MKKQLTDLVQFPLVHQAEIEKLHVNRDLKIHRFCMYGKGKLPVHVAINMGRLPLTPEKQVGYQVEQWCHYHGICICDWEIMANYSIIT